MLHKCYKNGYSPQAHFVTKLFKNAKQNGFLAKTDKIGQNGHGQKRSNIGKIFLNFNPISRGTEVVENLNNQIGVDGSTGLRKLTIKCVKVENAGEVVCQADRTAGVKVTAQLSVNATSVSIYLYLV